MKNLKKSNRLFMILFIISITFICYHCENKIEVNVKFNVKAKAESNRVVANKNNLINRFNKFNRVSVKNPESDMINNTDNGMIWGWMSITSSTLANNDYYPQLETPTGIQKIYYDKSFTRLNPEFKTERNSYNQLNQSDPPYPTAFYFLLNDNYLYYKTLKASTNILGTIALKSLKTAHLVQHSAMCFELIDIKENKYKLCSEEKTDSLKFLCSIQKNSNLPSEKKCKSKFQRGDHEKADPPVHTRRITQPVFIIPLPSPVCNANWNYKLQGSNWECLCAEGKEQSPIDLPEVASRVLHKKSMALESEKKPNFEYILAGKIGADDDTRHLKKGDNIKLQFENHMLKIKHDNFGKIVTLDGGIYIAKEIQLKTPAEHTINGKRFDLEIQVIHYGITKGDVYKKIVFSVLFTSSPGALNKFFEKLNVYDLPNPIDKERTINTELYVPWVFYLAEEADITLLKPFSFFTYNGSLSTPPCEESVIVYVTSNPVPLSSTTITLLQEALRVPDLIDSKGNVKIDNTETMNFRETQPLNGRPVFHYDHVKYECDEIASAINSKGNDSGVQGHYEKVEKEIEKYIYVPGNEPSGIPHAMIVSDKEAIDKI